MQVATFTQEQVDLIFRKAAFAAAGARIPLAKLAVEETHMGLMEDKVVKNHFDLPPVWRTPQQARYDPGGGEGWQ